MACQAAKTRRARPEAVPSRWKLSNAAEMESLRSFPIYLKIILLKIFKTDKLAENFFSIIF
jgi:hypothetical protein